MKRSNKHPLPDQVALPLATSVTPARKPKLTDEEKRARDFEKKRRADERRRDWLFNRSSYGRIIPKPTNMDRSPITCPCGRVTLHLHAEGHYFFADKQLPLGQQTLTDKQGKPVHEMSLHKCKRWLEQFGCELHVLEEKKRAEHKEQA